MAIYDLNQSNLDRLLGHNVSHATEAAIISTLKNAGEYPSGVGKIWTEYVKSSGSVTRNVPQTMQFFLEEGRNVNEKLNSHGNVALNIVNIGGNHNDTLIGGTGTDHLTVHTGNNMLIAGSGHDTLQGGSGHDTLIGGGHSKLQAGSGANVLTGGYKATSHDTLIGGAGSDTLTAYHGHDVIRAGSGHDTINAGNGHDTIYGATKSGSDTVTIGSGGSDVFHGGTGHNTLYVTGQGDDTIYGVSHTHTTVHLENTRSVTHEHHLGGGVTQIVFGNGQTIDVKGAKLIFSDGHPTQIV
jgi:Ca2+-binding RTX toxin-like protein